VVLVEVVVLMELPQVVELKVLLEQPIKVMLVAILPAWLQTIRLVEVEVLDR
jgi:hypothetical protein